MLFLLNLITSLFPLMGFYLCDSISGNFLFPNMNKGLFLFFVIIHFIIMAGLLHAFRQLNRQKLFLQVIISVGIYFLAFQAFGFYY